MNLDNIFQSIYNIEEPDSIKFAYYIIQYCNEENISITNLKLNKLLYFMNIQYMLDNSGIPLFEEEFLAWRHGPVLQSVYNKFCYGIVLPKKEKFNKIISELSDDQLKIIKDVLKRRANLPAWQLVEETHVVGGPWEEVYKKNKDSNGICKASIPNKQIYQFYRNYCDGI